MKPYQQIRQLLSLAASTAGVQALAALSNLLVIKIAAPLGADAIAVVSTGQRLFMLVQAVLIGLNVGSVVLVSRAWGGGERQVSEQSAARALMIAVFLSLVLMIVYWLLAPWFIDLFSLPRALIDDGVGYIRTLALFFIPIGLYLAMTSVLRACGDAYTTLLSGIVVNILVVILAFACSQGVGGFSGLGVAGIALGFGLAYLIVLLGYLFLLLRQVLIIQLRPQLDAFSGMLKVLRLGLPAALAQGVRQGSILAFLWVVSHYGTAAYTAYGVGIILSALSLVIGQGFTVATAISMGQALGRGDQRSAMQVMVAALVIALVLMSGVGVLLGLYSTQLATWMVGVDSVADSPVAYYTALFVHIYSFAQPLIAADFVLAGGLQALGLTQWPLYAALLGSLVVRFGLALVLLAFDAPIQWIYALMVADFSVKVVLQLWRIHSAGLFQRSWSLADKNA